MVQCVYITFYLNQSFKFWTVKMCRKINDNSVSTGHRDRLIRKFFRIIYVYNYIIDVYNLGDHISSLLCYNYYTQVVLRLKKNRTYTDT